MTYSDSTYFRNSVVTHASTLKSHFCVVLCCVESVFAAVKHKSVFTVFHFTFQENKYGANFKPNFGDFENFVFCFLLSGLNANRQCR